MGWEAHATSILRSSKSPTVLAAAIAVRPPARWMSSAMVGTEMYLPPDNSSPFFTAAGVSTSIACLGSISGPIHMVCDDPVLAGINTCHKRRPVYHRRSWDKRHDDCEKSLLRARASKAPACFVRSQNPAASRPKRQSLHAARISAERQRNRSRAAKKRQRASTAMCNISETCVAADYADSTALVGCDRSELDWCSAHANWARCRYCCSYRR